MSVVGPIGRERLAAFALSRAVGLPGYWRANGTRTVCKLCGAELLKGEGQPVLVAGDAVGFARPAFACAACFGEVCAAHAEFPTPASAMLRVGRWSGEAPTWWVAPP